MILDAILWLILLLAIAMMVDIVFFDRDDD